MRQRFRDIVSVVPAVRIGVARAGLTTTIGGQQTERTGKSTRRLGDYRRGNGRDGPLPTDPYLVPGTKIAFGSGDVARMTSPGLGAFKELLIATRQRKQEIEADLRRVRRQEAGARARYVLGWATLVAAVPAIRRRLALGLATHRHARETLRANLANTTVRVDFDMESAIAEPHRRMIEAFEGVRASARCWSLSAKHGIDRAQARSWAATIVERTPVAFARGGVDLVETSDAPLLLGTIGGHDRVYLYPGFVLVEGTEDFALLDLKDVRFDVRVTEFSESQDIPPDGELVGETWAKANKDGSRDKRFKDNRMIPILRYGQIHISSPGGLNEAYLVSRPQACAQFGRAVNELRALLATGEPAKAAPRVRAITGRR